MNKKLMNLGIKKARNTMNKNIGGPFGAVIADKEGNVISISSNSVIKDNDPTAHAEINAIRKACKKLNTYDLNDYVLYTTSHPCPMCLSAIIWANIKTVFYGCSIDDCEKIGFRDNFIYNYIKGENKNILNINQICREDCIELFSEYSKMKKIIY